MKHRLLILKSGSLFRQLDRSTGLLDLLESGLRRVSDVERHLRRQFTIAEHAYTVLGAADNACLDECSSIDGLRRIKLLGIDRRLKAGERDFIELVAEDVHETALRQAAVDWHLAAFEAVDGNAGTGLLSLDAASARLAEAGTDTTAHALARLGGAFSIPELVELHSLNPGSLRPRRRREPDGSRRRSCHGRKAYLPAWSGGASC